MRVRTPVLPLALAVMACAEVGTQARQQPGVERLPTAVLDVVPPSAHVRGVPGSMSVQPRPCRILPTADTRRRIVDVAAQEWGFFGFRVAATADDGENDAPEERGRRRPRLTPAEAARVATSIAGYWAVTPEGSWVVARQNERWTGPDGITSRWNAPWSASFVSWVMCEGGLGATTQFQRAIAHHTYIDQALRARDGGAPQAAFVAYDAGETAIAPGDLVCSSRRPAYRTLADRRRHMGVGARSHCDVVVRVDDAGRRVFAIGGNVRGVVSLKVFPAVRGEGRPLRVDSPDDSRPVFAHLKLRAAPIDADALDTSPTVEASSRGRLSDAHRPATQDGPRIDWWDGGPFVKAHVWHVRSDLFRWRHP